MSLVGGLGWVWLGGTLLLLVPEREEQARTLLGPEETPAGVVLWFHFWPGRPNAWGFRVVAAAGLGCGCVLSVA